ncbi:MAG: GbsR/MarR family transcriptional regulator [Pikeienuella sp.]
MTEQTELSKDKQAFVLSWAEAVSGWGLARSAGRLHGLLLVAEQPLAADELAVMLGIARSNISTSLRDLLAMGVIEAVPEIGERRTRYAAVGDAEAMALALFAHQKARLFDPARDVLANSDVGGEAGKRLARLSAFATGLSDWLDSGPGIAADVAAASKPKKKKKKK